MSFELEPDATDTEATLARRGLLPVRCICGPDSTGEAPDERPDCPVHGLDAAWGDTGWEGPPPF
jgi:hypothetical protein